MKRREFVKYGLIIAGVGGICGFCLKQNGSKYSFEKMPADKMLNNSGPCLAPFENIEIHSGGDIYPCVRIIYIILQQLSEILLMLILKIFGTVPDLMKSDKKY